MKPDKISIYTCPICGASFVDAGPARRCTGLHLDSRDLRIHHGVIQIPGTKHSHHPGDPYPAAISIYSDKSEGMVTYVRVESMIQVKAKTRRPNTPMLGK